jgi:hypothetical protein
MAGLTNDEPAPVRLTLPPVVDEEPVDDAPELPLLHPWTAKTVTVRAAAARRIGVLRGGFIECLERSEATGGLLREC